MTEDRRSRGLGRADSALHPRWFFLSGGALLIAIGYFAGLVSASPTLLVALVVPLAAAHLLVHGLAKSSARPELTRHAGAGLDLVTAATVVFFFGDGASVLFVLLAALPHSLSSAGLIRPLAVIAAPTVYILGTELNRLTFNAPEATWWTPRLGAYLGAALLVTVLALLARRQASVLNRLRSIDSILRRHANGDLQPEVAAGHQPETERLERSINRTLEVQAERTKELPPVIQEISALAGRLLDQAAGMQNALNLARSIPEALQPISESDREESASNGTEDSVDLEQIRVRAAETEAEARELAELLADELSGIRKTANYLRELQRQLEHAVTLAAKLCETSGGIDALTQTILKIGRHTQVLALNAAIEAAHAGDHGQGFSIVAGRVRQLATEASQAARAVADRSAGVQTETEAIVHELQDGAETLAKLLSDSEENVAAVEQLERKSGRTLQTATQLHTVSKAQLTQRDRLVEELTQVKAARTRWLALEGPIVALLETQREAAADTDRAAHDLSLLAAALQSAMGQPSSSGSVQRNNGG